MMRLGLLLLILLSTSGCVAEILWTGINLVASGARITRREPEPVTIRPIPEPIAPVKATP